MNFQAREYVRGLHASRDQLLREKHQQQQRPRPFTYGELSENERYPGLDRESARPALEIGGVPGGVPPVTSSPARYRHSYAEPPRLGLAALHPY